MPNIIDLEMTITPGIIKLVHCKSCDTTFAVKTTPKVCPYCGAPVSGYKFCIKCGKQLVK